jgi:hypothetical protein
MHAVVTLLVLLVFWLGWHHLNRLLYRDAFSPLNLLFYFWAAPFILSLAKLSDLQTGLEPKAAVVIALSTLVLVATCLVPAMPGVRQRRRPSDSSQIRAVRVKPAGVLCFFALTAVSLYFAEFSDRDLPLIVYLLGNAADSTLHTAGKDSKLQVIAFGIHAASIFVFYLWLNERRLLRRALYLTLSLAVIAIGLVKASKSDIFLPILSYGGLIYYHYHLRRAPPRAYPAVNRSVPGLYKSIALATLLMVVSVTSIRLGGVGLTGGYAGLIEFRYADELGAIVSETVSIIYGYTALGFQNFSNYVDSHEVVFRIGTSLFRPLLSALMMGDLADSLGVPVDSWNVVSDAANTGTFLTPLYIEGGTFVCLLGSLVYGLLVNVVYLSFRSTRSAVSMFLYISLLFPWTWLFFTNAFSVLSIYVNLFYVAILSWLFVQYPRRDGAGPASLRTLSVPARGLDASSAG